MGAVEDAKLVEQWFRRRGFTALLEGTAMRRNPALLARVLTAVFVVTLLVINPLAATAPAVSLILGAVALVVTWVGLNLVARRRPLTPPREVTGREQLAFVLVPALVVLATPSIALEDGELRLSGVQVSLISTFGTLVAQLLALAVILLVVRSGLVAAFPWLGRQVAVSFLSAGVALGRTLPLLLGVVGLFYFTGEIWQSIGRLASWAYLGVLALFGALSWLFIHSRKHLDLDQLATFADPGELDAILADTPLVSGAGVDLPARTPLAPRHESDLRLVATLSRLTVVTVISAAVFAFFVLLGLLAINAETLRSWLAAPPATFWSFETTRHHYDLTWEHLRVAGFLGVFSGFYFSLVSRTDAALRESIVDTAEDAVREACAARLVALARYPRQP